MSKAGGEARGFNFEPSKMVVRVGQRHYKGAAGLIPNANEINRQVWVTR